MSPDLLLQYLPPFTGRREVLKVDQSVPDIIREICRAHNQYKRHYQIIYPYFIGNGVKETANNTWQFLKKNSAYVIEPDNMQTVKTPAAILATSPKKYGGNDCKNLALFSAGILDAYRQAPGENFDLCFRFAGYNGRDISHVFTVVKKDGKEIWIDPVLNSFNSRDHIPTRYKDKTIEKMALVGLSGVNPYENNKQLFATESNPVPGSAVGIGPTFNPDTFKNIKTKAFFTKAQQVTQKVAPGSGAAQAASLAVNVATGNWAAAGVQIVQALSNLFKKDAPGDYWKAWESIDQQYGNPIGASVQHWIWRDGDSVQNEALNIISYIQNNDPDLQKTLSPNRTTLRDSGGYITFEDLLNKLRRGGYSNEAEQLKAVYDQMTAPPDQPAKKAGMNMLVTVGLVGAAAFFLLKKGK